MWVEVRPGRVEDEDYELEYARYLTPDGKYLKTVRAGEKPRYWIKNEHKNNRNGKQVDIVGGQQSERK